MENCVIYSHQIDFDRVVDIVRSSLPKAKIDVTENGLMKSMTATIKGGLFSKSQTLQIHHRQRLQPSYELREISCDLTQNLAGMVNFIQNIPAQNPDLHQRFAIKVMAANSEMSFMATPKITDPLKTILRNIVQTLDGFIFSQPNSVFNFSSGQQFIDKDFTLILDSNGRMDVTEVDVTIDAQYHDGPSDAYTDAQIQRKANSESVLEQHNIKVNYNLPCTPDSSEIKLRSKNEILDRIYALMSIAAYGEGVPKDQLENVISAKNITGFSPQEKSVLAMESLDEQTKTNSIWRYESLYALMWAAGLIDTLHYPSDICNVQELVGLLMQHSRTDIESRFQLRPVADIVAALDEIYRMHWACVDARIKGEAVGGNIHAGIIYERHYALNWLTNYNNQAWDDVQTNT